MCQMWQSMSISAERFITLMAIDGYLDAVVIPSEVDNENNEQTWMPVKKYMTEIFHKLQCWEQDISVQADLIGEIMRL